MWKSWSNPQNVTWRVPDRGLYMGTNTETTKDVYLPIKWLPTHLWIQGPPGVGKSALLLWMFGLLCRVPKACVILVNPKGELGRLARDYAFANGMGKRVAMFDPSDSDHIAGYNPLRANGLALATHAKAVRSGIRAAWGQANFDQTAQLARLLFLVLFAARELNLTLVEAVGLLRPRSKLRAAILPRIRDIHLREALEYIHSLAPGRQEELLASSMARLEAWCIDPGLRRIVTQQEHALDIGEILANRGILIANLELYKPLVHDDVMLLARLLVNDIVAHCFARTEKERTPVFLLIDEVHAVASADLCHALSMGRELGLHCVLAHQHEAQLREEAAVPGLADALLSCARTKILFGGNAVRHLESTVKEFFVDAVNPMRIKDVIRALELEPVETRRLVVTDGVSRGWGESTTKGWSRNETRGWSQGKSRSKTRGRSVGDSETVTQTKTHGASRGRSRGESEGESHGTTSGEMEGTSVEHGKAQVRGKARTRGIAVTSGRSSGSHTGVNTGHSVLPDGEVLVTLSEASGASSGESSAVTGTRSDTESESVSASQSRGRQTSRSKGRSHSVNKVRSTGESEGRQWSESEGESHGENWTESQSETDGVDRSGSGATTRGEDYTEGTAKNVTRNETQSWVPFHAYRKRRVVTTRTYMTADEQLLEKLQQVQALPQAQFVLKVGNNPAVFVRAPYVAKPRISHKRLAAGLERVYQKPYYASPEEVDREEQERSKQLRLPVDKRSTAALSEPEDPDGVLC